MSNSYRKLLPAGKKAKTRRVFNRKSLRFERLEDRRVLALLGVTPGLPTIAYNQTGILSYDSASNQFIVDATPLTALFATPPPARFITGAAEFDIRISVNEAGVATTSPGDDLVIRGDLDVNGNGSIEPSESGVLLTGEILAFGHENGPPDSQVDLYDFRFQPTGGALAPEFAGKLIGVTLTSEASTFNGSFETSFGGGAKGLAGSENPEQGPLRGITVIKKTNGLESGAIIPPGGDVTWTYEVKNIGSLPYTQAEIVVVDDNGTPGDTGDDFMPTLVPASDVGGDGILSPGETWTYSFTAPAPAPDLYGPTGPSGTFTFPTQAGTDGPDGNERTSTADGVNAKARAYSRDKGTGAWAPAYLGSYGGGLGVTDSSEGTGANDSHTVDNLGRDNYIVFEFDETIVVDKAHLGYVVSDSDLSIWIGNKPSGFTIDDDTDLAGLATQENLTSSPDPRTADFNAGNLSGNILIIAAWTLDGTPDDQFKIENVSFASPLGNGCYVNKVKVTAPGASSEDDSNYCQPRIDIEKKTTGHPNANPVAPTFDNEDAPDGPGVPLLTPGDTVTWTYLVTNTGSIPIPAADITVTDSDPGVTPTLVVTPGTLDGVLSPGEVWTYTATGVVQPVGTGSGSPITFDFSGSSATSGTEGNVRTYDVGGVKVKASAFSRDKTSGAWDDEFLGAYSGGLGVTDDSEGNGSGDTHTVDNVGRDNYVLLRFDQNVVVDSTFLGYVVNDSDLTAWIGTIPGAYAAPNLTLSDMILAGLVSEVNTTDLATPRTANLNAANLTGNVLIIAAQTNDATPEDRFKLEKATIKTSGCYANTGTVSVMDDADSDSDKSHYCNPPANPGIDIEKKTDGPSNTNATAPDYDNEDAANGAGVPILAPGGVVTWTYKVTNTGNVPFTFNQVVVTDDGGTPANTADDLSTAPGDGITFLSVQTGDADNILEPGEVWLYKATGTVQTLSGGTGTSATFDFSGSSALDGTNGNIRTFTAGSVQVKASAFSRVDASGTWSTAYLGSYGGGLGVTDSGEGTGAYDTHTVDNLDGRDNYVLFEFNQSVVVDSAFLGYVVGDSDLTIWIGTKTDPFNNHQTLSDAFLTSLGFTEVNLTDLTSSRTADFNAGNLAGNVVVIAAQVDDTTPEDRFKIELLKVKTTIPGVYENKAVVTVPGDTDSDLSHYKNPNAPPPTGSIGGYVYKECDADACKESGEYGLAGVTVQLYKLNGPDDYTLVAETTTASNGSYKFNNLAAGEYTVVETQPTGYLDGGERAGSHGGTVGTYLNHDFITDIVLAAGANATDYNFAELVGAKLSGYVYKDLDNDGWKDSGEYGIQSVKIILTGTDTLGRSVYREAWTNSSGYYAFDNLWAGTYTITECDPSNYYDGKDTLGSLGGTKYNDKFTNICVKFCDVGTGYNFGERL
jgi:uncharacterized repeat protein (TIGR01451 family)